MTTDTAIRLQGEDLRAAREVMYEAIVASVMDLGESFGGDRYHALVQLGNQASTLDALGSRGEPLRPHVGCLTLLQAETLVTAARWEDVLGVDCAENCGLVEPELSYHRDRVSRGRRVLGALGAERGNPSDFKDPR